MVPPGGSSDPQSAIQRRHVKDHAKDHARQRSWGGTEFFAAAEFSGTVRDAASQACLRKHNATLPGLW